MATKSTKVAVAAKSSNKSTKIASKGKVAAPTKAKIERTRLDPAAKIKVLVTENPYRKDSDKAKFFSMLKTGMTVEAAKAKGVPSDRINWAVKRELISVK